jgi:hypothetical protein
MKHNKSSLGGQIITRNQALEELGNPKTWDKEAARLMIEFTKKPSPKFSPKNVAEKFLLRTRELTKVAGGFVSGISGSVQPEPVFAKNFPRQKKSKRRRNSTRRSNAVRKRKK